MRSIKKLRPLSPGDCVAVVAPGSPSDPLRIKAGVQALERRGFRVKLPLDPSASYQSQSFCSASVSERASSFLSAFSDQEVAAVLTARGGYGSSHLLPCIDFNHWSANGKPFVGYSDVTVLLVALLGKTDTVTIHGGTVATEFASNEADEVESVELLLEMLSNSAYRFSYNLQTIREGRGEGPLIAGNLTMLTSLLGTPWDISYDGAILVLEEVGEAPYRIHRQLTHLALAGKLDKLAGLVFGRFSRCERESGKSVEEVLDESVTDIIHASSYPVLAGLEFGHNGKNVPLPLGCRARIRDKKFELLESPLA